MKHITRRLCSLYLAGLVCAAIFLVPCGTAAAQDNFSLSADFDQLYRDAGLMFVLAAGIPFAGVEIAYAMESSWLPPVWAILQFVLAATPITISGVGCLATERTSFIAPGIFFTLIGGWFTVNSILSLFLYRSVEPNDTASSAENRIKLGIHPSGNSITASAVMAF